MPIHVHPKDPFKRVDILPSTRHIKIEIDGKVVAESNVAWHLYETGLPTRYYLPLSSVHQMYLRRSDLRTRCPYKGEAQYYHVQIGDKLYENRVWYYTATVPESTAIIGAVCFYNEKVDIYLEGKKLPK